MTDAELEVMFAEAATADAADGGVFGTARGEPPARLRGRADRGRRFTQAKELVHEEVAAERQAHDPHLAERAASRLRMLHD